MELLLNLAWLLLALPAYWLWRASRTAPSGHRATSLQCVLALGCMLVLLFPVVSATDDLHAMGAEMEESPASKRSVRQASAEKASAWKWQSPPALATTTRHWVAADEAWRSLLIPFLSIPATPVTARTGRSPPASFPA